MRKTAIVLTTALCLMFGSCMSGPHQTFRTVDDWDQQLYVDNPWLNALLWIIPVFPLARFGASVVDFFVVDGYAFWIKDAFTGEGGTGFLHKDADNANKTMKSLLRDDGKFLQIGRGD